ncbi:inhibitor of growth protein 3 isoform X1 [Diabrotica undecimpunctata]|uniref:inhibitor of growth protein 3 isoform X1 n=1 Tax=Diabrotica undecimpunctata TaxID=50387 RepID=UPI003B638AF9
MLYLEDYLEMIEHLPQELRDRFTDMREMDLTIHNNMDELEKRVKNFFSDCKRCPNDLPQSVEAEFQAIRKEYYKTLEEADEKVHLASQMYDLVDKYLRRLDSELHKFKCELEADNKGITEVLEKRSLELDTPNTTPNISSLQQKENRYDSTFRYSRPRAEKRRDSSVSIPAQLTEKRQTVTPVAPPPLVETRHATTSVQPIAPSSATTTTMSYNLGHNLGAGPAIAAAASQAIAATQQMQQGRRTASLKASYEAINTGVHGHEFGIGRELAGAAQTAIQAIQQDHANNKKKQKKWNSSSSSSTSTVTVVQPVVSTPVVIPPPESPTVDTNSQNAEVTDGEWTYDPNEPRYCLCNQVSYGDMVACDNEDFPKSSQEWAQIGKDFENRWNFPNCGGAIDGKHVRIIKPPNSGSYFYNYKGYCSIVLMAIVNADYEFVYVNCGCNGRVSDGGVLEVTDFFEKLTEGDLHLPNSDSTTSNLNFVFVGDDAFALNEHLLKPYPNKNLNNERRIFNYRLSRARNVVENAFGILANRFRILHTEINMKPEKIDLVVMACCVLHNFLRRNAKAVYMPPSSTDIEDLNSGTVINENWREGYSMDGLQTSASRNVSQQAKDVREMYEHFFVGEGKVSWQDRFL